MTKDQASHLAAALPVARSANSEAPALLVDRPEAAARLAISLRTLDEITSKGDLAAVRIGRAVRYRPAALEAFIEANETKLSAKRRAAMGGKRK